MRILVFALIALTPVQSALAKDCYKIKFENETDVAIKVIWRAAGCAGLVEAPWQQFHGYYDIVCRNRTVEPGKSDTYTVKWGQTKPTAYLQFDYKINGTKRAMVDKTVYRRKNRHEFIQDYKFHQRLNTPVNCKKDFTYKYTQDDLLEAVKYRTALNLWDM